MKRRINISLIILIFFISAVAFGQNYFNKSIPLADAQAATSIQQLSDGGYLIAGQNYKSNSQTIFFMRVDINGDTVWTKEYGNTSTYYWVNYSSLNTTSDGNYICAVTMQDSTSNYDAILLKFTINGDTLWSKKFGGPYFDAGRDCQQTTDGGYMLVVDSDSLNNGLNDCLLIKTDSIGNIEWKKRYDAGGYDVAVCGLQTLDGGYIISGARGSSNWIVKADSMGQMEWSRTYSTGTNDGLCWISQLSNGEYISAGAKVVTGMNKQAGIRKLKPDGTINWEKLYGGVGNDAFHFNVIEFSESYALVGNYTNPVGKYEGSLLKIDTAGNHIWERTYTYNYWVHNYVCDVKKTTDNGFIICGQTFDISNDVWLLKLDSAGCESANCNVGINEQNEANHKFIIYPNPTDKNLNISIEGKKVDDYNITITNIIGQMQEFTITDSIISLEKFAPGLYIISATSKKGEHYLSQKFIKQ
ncbi:MAG: T9SS type A sorting domain-containing protein [Chitinophagaceae bacterium]|nr:T9SS type A sorting domain-containing protein [Chitinophagaceae bacterium]